MNTRTTFAAPEGWAGIDQAEQLSAEQQEAARQARADLDRLYAACFGTPAGQVVLRHLCTLTIEQPAWVPGLDASHGYAREGQNSIVREIQARVARAQNPTPLSAPEEA